MSVAFVNQYAAGRKAASLSQAPCPADASAETKLGYIAERATTTPSVAEVAPLLDQLSPIRRAVICAALHGALMKHDLIGSSVAKSVGPEQRALVAALLQGAQSI